MDSDLCNMWMNKFNKKKEGVFLMSKMKKCITVVGIVLLLVAAEVSQGNVINASETMGVIKDINEMEVLSEAELIEPEYEKGYVVVSDIVVESKLIDNENVEIMLMNTGAFDINKWTVVYVSSYNIVKIDNAELVLNSQVKKIEAVDENKMLESGDSITISMEISGTYESDTKYRVYGLCDDISEQFSVMDCISYNVSTGTTSLMTFDYEDMPVGISGTVSTKGLDVVDTYTDSLTDGVVPAAIIPDATCSCICPCGDNCKKYCDGECYCDLVCEDNCEDNCECISDTRTEVSNVNVAPYNKIAVVISKFRKGTSTKTLVGTVFLVSPTHMLTAAHVVYDLEYGIANSVDVYFGAKGYTYAVKVSASNLTYCSSFKDDYLPEYDWGHIELSTNPGRGYFSMSTSVLPTDTITVCGYPLDKRVYDIDGYLYYMFIMSGKPVVIGNEVLYYNIDTTDGQSGGPVYNTSNVVVGINCQHGTNNGPNKACRIKDYMLTAFASYGWCSLE